MNMKHLFHILSAAMLTSIAALLIFSQTASADADTPQSPPIPHPTISATSIDATDDSPDGINVDNCDGDVFPPQNEAFEQRIIALMNEARAEHNLPPLKSTTELNDAARYHARDMYEDEYFEHHTYDRENGALVLACAWNERIRLYYGDYLRLGENIARGYPTPESVFQGWMDSEGHRGNILHPNYREVGVGYYNTYWSQAFGEREHVFPVVINHDFPETDSQNINVYAYGEWDQVRLRNDNGQWSDWMPFAHNLDWTLPAVVGPRTVEAEMRRSDASSASSDSINFVGGVDGTEPLQHDINSLVYLPVVTR